MPGIFLSTPTVKANDGDGWRVGIVDSGLYDDDGAGQTRRDGEACYSLPDEAEHNHYYPDGRLFGAIGPFDRAVQGSLNHYYQASTCPNGETNSTRRNSSVVPRQAGHEAGLVGLNLQTGQYIFPPQFGAITYYRFGRKHGSNVVKAYAERAARGKVIMINSYHFEGGPGTGCGFHEPLEDEIDCYKIANTSIRRSFERILNMNTANIAAVNLSLGRRGTQNSCNSTLLRSQINQLNNRNIPVFASLGNDSGTQRPDSSGVEPVSWPACVEGVIAVGAVGRTGQIESYNNSAGRVDFWDSGRVVNYDGAGESNGTSFAAPRVAGAFTSIKSSVPNASTQEILAALRVSGTLLTDTRAGSGATAPLITGSSISAAIDALQGNPAAYQVVQSSTADFTGMEFGTSFAADNFPFGVNLEFQALAITAATTPSPPTPPNGYMVGDPFIDGYQIQFRSHDLSTDELAIYINGEFYRNVRSDPFGFSSRTNTYTITGSEFEELFGNGTNNIEFRHSTNFIGSDWGISQIEITPVIEYTFVEIPATVSLPAIQLLLLD